MQNTYFHCPHRLIVVITVPCRTHTSTVHTFITARYFHAEPTLPQSIQIITACTVPCRTHTSTVYTDYYCMHSSIQNPYFNCPHRLISVSTVLCRTHTSTVHTFIIVSTVPEPILQLSTQTYYCEHSSIKNPYFHCVHRRISVSTVPCRTHISTVHTDLLL